MSRPRFDLLCTTSECFLRKALERPFLGAFGGLPRRDFLGIFLGVLITGPEGKAELFSPVGNAPRRDFLGGASGGGLGHGGDLVDGADFGGVELGCEVELSGRVTEAAGAELARTAGVNVVEAADETEEIEGEIIGASTDVVEVGGVI